MRSESDPKLEFGDGQIRQCGTQKGAELKGHSPGASPAWSGVHPCICRSCMPPRLLRRRRCDSPARAGLDGPSVEVQTPCKCVTHLFRVVACGGCLQLPMRAASPGWRWQIGGQSWSRYILDWEGGGGAPKYLRVSKWNQIESGLVRDAVCQWEGDFRGSSRLLWNSLIGLSSLLGILRAC